MVPRASDKAGTPADIRDWAVSLFDTLREQSFDGTGISRESYGPSETLGMETLAAAAHAEGLEISTDAAANIIVTLPGQDRDAPAIACGSHVDSVPQGGNFDGAAGVVAGLMALVRAKQEGPVPPRDIKVFMLRGEESAWFGRAYVGSSAMFGGFDPKDIKCYNDANQ